MKKVDQEALDRGEKIKTIVTRFEEHSLTGERKTVFLYAMMWMDPKNKTAFIEPIDNHPLSEDEVIAFNKENGLEGLGDYVGPPREYWEEKTVELPSEYAGYDIEQEIKASTTEPKGKTFCVKVKQAKKAEAIMQWLKDQKVHFLWSQPSDPSDSHLGIKFFIPSKLYKEVIEFLDEDDQNIVLISRD